MKILVTGGAGFIGSNIVDTYIAAGHEVSVLDNLSSGRKENINIKAAFHQADITDEQSVKEIFSNGNFDVVSHHAAQIDVRKSVENPKFDASVNILGALNILENAKNNGIKKVIFASSGGTIYGECGSIPPDEKAEARPLSPYGIAKYSVEFYLKFYAAIHGIKYTILRYANVYGPRQDPHGEAGVVAIFSDKMLNGEDVFIYGNGDQKRDYVFIGDLVKANLSALDRADNDTINIGTAIATSVIELFNEMAEITGYDKAPVHKPARPGELFNSVLGVIKAESVLKWKPNVTLKDGLRKTIEYFRSKK